MSTNWMTTAQAATRLGVKPETLYAYVSRGLIGSERTPGGRRSRFLRADVERLAARRRGGGRAGGLEIIIGTELTLLDPTGHLAYRGWEVGDAVTRASFEEVATWLWTGERLAGPWAAPPDLVRLARRVVRALPTTPTIDQLRAATAVVRAADPLRHDRRAAAVATTGRGLIATLVDVLPVVGSHAAPRSGSIAARLWSRLGASRPTSERVRLLDATLVLLADHELAASTLAARVAASTWADPYLVVQAGLATLGGPLHGGASEGARELIREVAGGRATAAEAVGARLRDGELVAGFGHRVYLDHDPRAEILLRLLGARSRTNVSDRAARELLGVMYDRELPFPNIDFAIALLAESHGMGPSAGELIFAVARIAGWLAHAIEEYEHRLRYRPRAAYTGPAPTRR